ncbi:hypothetical protein H9X88_00210 [Aeromonas hydrophila]|uniref:hypothetical protein n=1 Tax=Aeromonas TaxID=642 RepID=UPI001B3A211C|nr:hypothetical protein [Aeromonas hydrophila]MBQ4677647.1 hypothetical protein [Aeromonas hydrophila]MBW3816251.1 hypothetical protein [Aeromonas hydrophila]MCF7676590.1 hypothetical protein [Aeromonas hydrophila]MCF7773330.1 hypothetical protein [Aeromonas hydrophila]
MKTLKVQIHRTLKTIREYIVFYVIHIIPIVRNLFLSGERLNNISYGNNSNKCIIIGNGPSLKHDIIHIKENIGVCDFFGVNHFCESSDFEEIKPTKYTLLDAYFWAEDASDELKEKRLKMFTKLNSIDWRMKLFVPSFCNKGFINSIITNAYITVHFYKVIPVTKVDLSDSFMLCLFKNGKYGPAACNVLIYGLYLAMMSGYKEIDIYGADLSFHNDVVVDQIDNTLKIKYKHFYGETEFVPLMKNPQKVEPFKMSELMELTFETFLAHDRLAVFAAVNSVVVRNKSSYSMIDSYLRQ